MGATTLIGNDTDSGERAVSKPGTGPANAYYSGGGFSNIFPVPSYQASAVKKFMKNYAPNYGPNVYNDTGKARGFPDVAAIGLTSPPCGMHRRTVLAAPAPVPRSLLAL